MEREDGQGEKQRDPFARFVAIAGGVVFVILVVSAFLVWQAAR